MLRPKDVAALGATAGAALFSRTGSASRQNRLLGIVGLGVKMFLIVHPADALRQPKREAKSAPFALFANTLAMAAMLRSRPSRTHA